MPPIDVDATVISNRRLSRDYNVLTLSAAEVGARTRAGQFVMVRPAGMTETLLRRPFSVFEVIRDTAGTATAISILNKRAGRTTNRLYEAEEGDRVACLGPLGRPFTPPPAGHEAWMVAGGVGLAPFWTLAEGPGRRGTPTTLFYGARSDQELFYLDFFEQLGVRLRAGHRRRIAGNADGSRCRSIASDGRPAPGTRRWCMPAAPSRCSRPWPAWRAHTGSRARCRSSGRWAAASAAATAAW
jgi:NAD(P)H-flavin reductase